MIKLIECPRDAMQGIKHFIPTALKIEYINALLRVGFDTIDFGSFVSHKTIPQMAATVEVLKGLKVEDGASKLLAIIANVRGAEEAVVHESINYLGFPFSISETFQMRNTNSTIEQSLINVEKIQNLCILNKKELVVYISMGFGNPYGDEWSPEVAINWVNELVDMGIKIISMSDTVGVGNPETISYLFKNLIPAFPEIEFGAHLHTHTFNWEEKIKAASDNGCKRFDGAMKGYGGCPMAADDLVGNMPTENLINYFKKDLKNINYEALEIVNKVVDKVFMGS
jgi:hydroxymethylglutaryl-CoA lyase